MKEVGEIDLKLAEASRLSLAQAFRAGLPRRHKRTAPSWAPGGKERAVLRALRWQNNAHRRAPGRPPRHIAEKLQLIKLARSNG